jgi:hypothetical protein
MVTLDTMVIGWRPADLVRTYLPFVHGVGCQQGFSDPVFMASQGLQPTHAHPTWPYEPDKLNALARSSDDSPEALEVRARMALAFKWMETEITSGWFPTWEKVSQCHELCDH